MTTCVVTFENRELPYKDCFRDNHSAFCERHGYTYIPSDSFDAKIPPYWAKVFIVAKYLKDYKWVVWIDSDAVFEKLEQPFIFDSRSFFVIGGDKPQHRIPAPINAGFFAVQNNDIGNLFMVQWCRLYKPHRWQLKHGKWVCKGTWSGSDYEQGACIELLADSQFASHIIHPWHEFNNHPGSGFNGTVYHFCGTVGKSMLRKYLHSHS